MARSIAEGRRSPAHPDDVRDGLREAGERRRDALARWEAADRERAAVMLDLAAWA